MKNTVHPLEGLVQGFFISDIGLKQKEEAQVQGSVTKHPEDQPLPTPQSIGNCSPYSSVLGSRAGLGAICTILLTPLRAPCKIHVIAPCKIMGVKTGAQGGVTTALNYKSWS